VLIAYHFPFKGSDLSITFYNPIKMAMVRLVVVDSVERDDEKFTRRPAKIMSAQLRFDMVHPAPDHDSLSGASSSFAFVFAS